MNLLNKKLLHINYFKLTTIFEILLNVYNLFLLKLYFIMQFYLLYLYFFTGTFGGVYSKDTNL